MPSQNQLILSHLMAGESITPMDALRKYGCMRLASRIRDLKKEGANIITRTEDHNGKKYASYYMVNIPQPSLDLGI